MKLLLWMVSVFTAMSFSATEQSWEQMVHWVAIDLKTNALFLLIFQLLQFFAWYELHTSYCIHKVDLPQSWKSVNMKKESTKRRRGFVSQGSHHWKNRVVLMV